MKEYKNRQDKQLVNDSITDGTVTKLTLSINIENQWVGSSEDGPFRDYELNVVGKNLDECLQDAWISEIDQDGGVITSHNIENYNQCIYHKCVEIIIDELKKSKDVLDLSKHDRSQDY